MRYVVLFEHSCAACSQVARAVNDLSVPGLEARPLEDPEVTGLLNHAGLQTPDRPSLLIVDGSSVQVLSGWAMRRRLAGMMGWRRSSAIAGLLAAEGRARLARSAGAHGPSRRGLIGGALAGAAGWALMAGPASASSRPAQSTPDMVEARPSEVNSALATAPGQQALSTWGAISATAYKVTSNGQSTLMLTHPRDGILTFIRMSPDTLLGNPAAVSLGAVPGAGHAMRYYSAGGTPLADLSLSHGQAVTSPVPHGTKAPGQTADAEPDISIKGIACFIACTGRKAGAGCIGDCISCVAGIAIKHPNPIACGECTACAGQHGVACVEACGL